MGLKFTETNSADDSQGRTWGLDGNLFWYVVGGAFASVMTFLLGFSMLEWTATTAFFIALAPLSLALLYVLLLRQGKPPGYDRDLVSGLLGNSGFAPKPSHQQPSHPLATTDTANNTEYHG